MIVCLHFAWNSRRRLENFGLFWKIRIARFSHLRGGGCPRFFRNRVGGVPPTPSPLSPSLTLPYPLPSVAANRPAGTGRFSVYPPAVYDRSGTYARSLSRPLFSPRQTTVVLIAFGSCAFFQQTRNGTADRVSPVRKRSISWTFRAWEERSIHPAVPKGNREGQPGGRGRSRMILLTRAIVPVPVTDCACPVRR